MINWRTTLIFVLFILLGFTEFLGGPYLFFRILFWISILPFLLGILFLVFAFLKIKSSIKNIKEEVNDSKEKDTDDMIHVDVKIKE